jgi:hypothetical protein
MTTSGQIPQSEALAEATGDSLSELWSRDPEGYREVDIQKTIEVMRARRAPWAAEEAARASGSAKPRKSRAEMLSTSSGASAGDLGL